MLSITRCSELSNDCNKPKAFASLTGWSLDSRTGARFCRCLRSLLAEQLSGAPGGCRTARPNPGFVRPELRQGIESGKTNRANQEQKAAEFRRALDAGEMPPLHPFVFTTDYSPTDFATMLQSGGVQLFDVETLIALRKDESVIRWGLSRMACYQKLSDELIVPNLDQDISFFYDPATKKLRKRFEIYPDALDAKCNLRTSLNVRTPNCSNRSKPNDSVIINMPRY